MIETTGLTALIQLSSLLVFYILGIVKYRKLKIIVELYVIFFIFTFILGYGIKKGVDKIITPKTEHAKYIVYLAPKPLPKEESLQDMVVASAKSHNVPIPIAKALVQVESRWNPKAISYAGASGLCQLMPGTFKWVYPEGKDIFNPKDNAHAGMKYLRELYNESGSWHTALAKYNGGGKYYKSLECQRYAEKVLSIAELTA